MPPIFGSGNDSADFLIVTEAPTLEDAAEQNLFAGDFGDMLNELLRVCGIDPDNTYRTTIVACPSYVIIPETELEPERIAYQSPDAVETKSCHPRLNEVIYTVDPALILTFGDKAWQALVPAKGRKNRNRVVEVQGDLYDAWIQGREKPIRYAVAPMLALSTIFGNPSMAPHAPRAATIKYLTRYAGLTAEALLGETI